MIIIMVIMGKGIRKGKWTDQYIIILSSRLHIVHPFGRVSLI
jgi:hypothetical protein